MSKSKTAISESLLELLANSSFHVVTISEIFGHARVARRTFYNNLDSKEDIVRFIVDKLVMEFIESIKNQHLDTPKPLGQAYYRFWYEKKDVVPILAKNRLFHILQRDFQNYLPQLAMAMGVGGIASQMDETLLDYVYTFVSSGLCYNLEKWAKGGYQEPYSQIGEVFNVIDNGLIE